VFQKSVSMVAKLFHEIAQKRVEIEGVFKDKYQR
jgi:hypothetical protein